MQTLSMASNEKSWKSIGTTVILTLTSLALLYFLGAYPRVIERHIPKEVLHFQWTRALAALIGLALVVAMIWVYRRGIGKSSLASLGLAFTPKSLLHFFAGAALSLAMFAGFLAVQTLLGQLQYTGALWQLRPPHEILRILISGMIVYTAVGINEELYFRGYLYALLKSRYGRLAAAVVSSLLFCLVHAPLAGFNVLVVANILLIAVVFLLLLERTGSLWLPIGMHFMWNYAQFHVLAVATPEVEPWDC